MLERFVFFTDSCLLNIDTVECIKLNKVYQKLHIVIYLLQQKKRTKNKKIMTLQIVETGLKLNQIY